MKKSYVNGRNNRKMENIGGNIQKIVQIIIKPLGLKGKYGLARVARWWSAPPPIQILPILGSLCEIIKTSEATVPLG